MPKRTSHQTADYHLPETGLLRAKQVHRYFGIGLSTWWLWVKQGRAPQGIRLGSRTTVWRAEDIRSLLDEISSNNASDQ